MKDRRAAIKTLEDAIAKTRVSILNQKAMLANSENKLERQMAVMVKERMLEQFDKIDEMRQMFSDAIARLNLAEREEHINQLERQDKI